MTAIVTLAAATPDAQALVERTGPAASAADLVKVHGRGGGAVFALDGVSVSFAPREFTAIMGPSGSGKSTLLHCIAGLDRPTSGRVRVAGVDLGGLSERRLTELRRDRIGFIFQQLNLVPTLTAAENIRLPLDIARRRVDPAWYREVVETVGLGSRLNHRPAELSGGQQQRVAAARALISRPAIIFADEPTGNLDSRSGGELLAFMRSCVDDLGQTIVMVTHDAAAAGHAHRVLFLSDGRLVDELVAPHPSAVIDRLKSLGG